MALRLAAVVALLGGPAAAQEWLPDAQLSVLTPEVVLGTAAAVEVEIPPGMDFPLTLDWGDGVSDTVDHHGALTQSFDHLYATAGLKVIELQLYDPFDNITYLIASDVILVTSPGTLDVSPALAEVGEAVTATVSGGPVGGRLTWGDGAIEVLTGGDEQFEHTYQAAGVYTLRLEDLGGTLLDSAVVSITASALIFDLPPSALLGEEVTLTIAGLASNAPTGARLDWGDGTVEVVQDDGEHQHSYARPGAYVVALQRLPGGEPLALATIAVQAFGFLELPAMAVLFERTPVAASGLAPGFLYRLDYGDGWFDLVNADSAGRIQTNYFFQQPLSSFEVTLTLVDGGQSVRLDRLRILAGLPDPTEEVVVEASPVPQAARFDLVVSATGLLPGVTYSLHSPQAGSRLLTSDAAGLAQVMFEAHGEGKVEFQLAALLTVPGAGFTERFRTAAEVTAAWPRGGETLAVEQQFQQVFLNEVVTVVAQGLHLHYGYDLVVNGRTDNPYRLARGAAATLPEPGVWRVELPVQVVGPEVRLELYARMPDPFSQLGPAELRASTAFTAVAPSGSLALPEPVVPYLVSSPLWVRDLMPGLAYRLEFVGGRVERFVGPAGGALDFEHRFAGAGSRVTLFVDLPGLDGEPVASVAPSGITFGGSLSYSYDVQRFLADGEVTFHLRGVAPGHVHVVDFYDGRRYQGEADADGNLALVTRDPPSDNVGLRIQVFGEEYFITQIRPVLPPRLMNFHYSDGWRVRVTRLDETPGTGLQPDGSFVPPISLANLSGDGYLENFVIGGRLQEPIAMTFAGVRLLGRAVVEGTAELASEALEVSLPQAVRGVQLRLTRLGLGAFGTRPQLAGRGSLPTGEEFGFDQVMSPTGEPGTGFMVMISARGPGAQIGTSPWRYQVGTFGAVLDLSSESNYNLVRPGGSFALQQAYRAYGAVGRPSPAETGAWVGVLYPDAAISLQAAGAAAATFTGDLAWTSAGPTTYLGAPLGDANGNLSLGGWTFRNVTGLELIVVDGQVARFTRPSGTVRLDFFGQEMPVGFYPYGSQWKVTTLTPVAQDYGNTAVVGGVGSFVQQGNRLVLKFPNALWALDGDLASEPSSLDTSVGDELLASLPGVLDAEEELVNAYDDAVATAETVLNLYQLQLLLKDLTLYPDGNADLGGSEWRTLARVPALDMFGFPYLSAGAEIGVKRSENRYAIGLKGELKLGEGLEARAAPSWYLHEGGREREWRFEGVGVKFGDFEGSPVTFSLIVGGVVDLQRLALSFTGAGSLTIPDVLSIEALGLFGLIDEGGSLPEFFWFVSAGVDLAQMGRPINVNINGVDVLAFYAFRGGIASKLRIDVGGGDCRVDDGNIPQLILPSIAANALDCYDPDLAVSLLAGTVIGSPVQGGAGSDLYGKVWHLDTNLVVNLGAGGDLQLAGQGWIGKNLDDGYRKRGSEPAQLAGRLVINAEGITGAMCAGPLATGSGVLDCSSLAPAQIRAGGLLLAEFKGAIEFKASWSTNQYYFALGTQRNPIYAYVIPRYAQGYFVVGYIRDSGILHPNVGLPAGGIWVGAESGFRWDWEKSGDLVVCSWRVYAGAGFGFGGSMGMQVSPSFRFSAQLTAHAWARAGGRVCGVGFDVSASIRATGGLSAPNPTRFYGDFQVKVKIPRVKEINVTVRNIGVTLN